MVFPLIEACVERHPRRFYLYADGIKGVTVFFRSKYMPPPNEIEQFYLLPPKGEVTGRQFATTCPESHAQTFTIMVILIFRTHHSVLRAMDVLRLFDQVRERE